MQPFFDRNMPLIRKKNLIAVKMQNGLTNSNQDNEESANDIITNN